MEIHRISSWRFFHTVVWSLILCGVIIGIAAVLGRATLNIKAALTDKPDIAIYLLLPDEEIGKTVLLREREDERDYLAETKTGPKLVRLKKGPTQWYVKNIEILHE